MSKQNEKMLMGATPMARRGTPEEIANVYLFLASVEASYVTGSLYEGMAALQKPREPLATKPEATFERNRKASWSLSVQWKGPPTP